MTPPSTSCDAHAREQPAFAREEVHVSPIPSRAWLFALAGALAAATLLALRAFAYDGVRLDVGGFDASVLHGDWGRTGRADVEPSALYFREAPPRAELALPMVVRPGPVIVALRATARVRSTVDAFFHGARLGQAVVPGARWEGAPGPWSRLAIAGMVPTEAPLRVALTVTAAPLVRRAEEELHRPQVVVDLIDVEAPGRLALTWPASLWVSLTPLVLCIFAVIVGLESAAALGLHALATIVALVAVRAAPVAAVVAIPRLAAMALLAGAAAALLARALRIGGHDRPALATVVMLGVLGHAALAFFPNHAPPDLDIHVRRTLDLGAVPVEYGALLRYGSHLPTASQDLGAATAALGDRFLIPYSPLPYLFYYALHAVGLDLRWAMTALGASAAMLVAPLVFAAATAAWNRTAGWLAVALYSLDLAVWHHLGRVHAPAVLGGALVTAMLATLVARVDRLAAPRERVTAVGLVALALLGYSSAPVMVGLFALVLLATLAVDARALEPPARIGLAMAVVGGGLVAGALFYFHYVPGVMWGATADLGPDLFPGRSFFIFHNESRQALRLWALGLWMTFLAGALALPWALSRARADTRPILVSWAAAWALVMLLKDAEPLARLLRWAKEDQFLSPLIALLVAGAIATLPRPWMRWVAAAAAVLGALALQIRDYAHHAVTLRL